MYKIVPTTLRSPAYILLKDSVEVAVGDSPTQLKDFAEILIGRERTARVINEQLAQYQSVKDML